MSRVVLLMMAFLVPACAIPLGFGAFLPGAAGAAEEDGMRATLAAERELKIERLHAYWTKGEFVENPEAAGGRGHFIFDGRGKPCPLAAIIIDSGRRDLVEEAARENNGVKVADLRDGPLHDWILSSGLTQEECVLIQQPSRSGRDVQEEKRRQESGSIASTLRDVERRLRRTTEESLSLAVRRLRARQPRDEARLAVEAGEVLGIRDKQQLDGGDAAQLAMARLPDFAHAALPDARLQIVRADALGRVAHLRR